MKITIITSNHSRHNYLINLISEISSELSVIMESKTRFPGLVPGSYPVTENMKRYFTKVNEAQEKIFGNSYIRNTNKVKILPLATGDINNCSVEYLKDFLRSEIYIVFGSSYIKGELADFLVKKKAINIHMGISPYYRGADCNFWALNDDNPNLVGATIHLLSKGLDTGNILYHALSEPANDPFFYTMSSVKAAFYSLKERIANKSIFDLHPELQDKTKQIRYSKKLDFTDEVVKCFLEKKIILKKKINLRDYKNPFILKS